MNQRNKERNSFEMSVHCDPGMLNEFTSIHYVNKAKCEVVEGLVYLIPTLI